MRARIWSRTWSKRLGRDRYRYDWGRIACHSQHGRCERKAILVRNFSMEDVSPTTTSPVVWWRKLGTRRYRLYRLRRSKGRDVSPFVAASRPTPKWRVFYQSRSSSPHPRLRRAQLFWHNHALVAFLEDVEVICGLKFGGPTTTTTLDQATLSRSNGTW